MEIEVLMKIIGAAADLYSVAKPHIADALATASETDAAALNAKLAVLASETDAGFARAQADLRGTD